MKKSRKQKKKTQDKDNESYKELYQTFGKSSSVQEPDYLVGKRVRHKILKAKKMNKSCLLIYSNTLAVGLHQVT